MEKSIDQRVLDLLINGSVAQRVAICEREPMYFAIYYFTEYFSYKIPPFHFDFYDDIKDLTTGKLDEAAWIAFRDSAKTSIAKIALVCWWIAYRKKTYINWDSYDRSNAEAALFDITVALQTNKKLISDFGHLYFKKTAKDAFSEAKMKRITSFITENDIKVEAFSTQESTRGRLYKNRRPDAFVFDDFENLKTADSYPITFKVIQHIDELKAGLPAGACVLYLGNYITENGSVEYVMNAVKRNPKGKLRLINVVDPVGNISWPDKFVMTDAEAAAQNALIPNPLQQKISVQGKEKSLGKAVFQREMMNNPAHGGDKVFDREKIEELLKTAKPPAEEIAGFKMWATYNPSHRYALAADTAKGIGKDSNASALIDFSTVPNKVVATYQNNLIAPDVFAYELERQANLFGQCLIAPEVNNTGYATVSQLKKIYPNNKIYLPLEEEKVKEKLSDEYGWETNAATKPEMIFQLKRAVEDGLLAIPDEDLLNELKYYGQKDLTTYRLIEGMTRHFDKLTAVAICWMMRNHAKISVDPRKKKVVQRDHIPAAGEYGG